MGPITQRFVFDSSDYRDAVIVSDMRKRKRRVFLSAPRSCKDQRRRKERKTKILLRREGRGGGSRKHLNQNADMENSHQNHRLGHLLPVGKASVSVIFLKIYSLKSDIFHIFCPVCPPDKKWTTVAPLYSEERPSKNGIEGTSLGLDV
uniref:Uncharacterized protein n=1 Tax=Steinernema glaseri TaxID=37863 RepID=A0A1I8A792_9BILA